MKATLRPERARSSAMSRGEPERANPGQTLPDLTSPGHGLPGRGAQGDGAPPGVGSPGIGKTVLRIIGRVLLPPRPAEPEPSRVRVCVAITGVAAREGVRHFLAAVPEFAVSVLPEERPDGALRGDDIVAAVTRAPHGVLLLDAAVRGPDAFEVIARVRALAPNVRTVLVAPADGPEVPLRALAFGAAGHLDARAGPDAYRVAVRTAARGEHVLSAVLAEALAAQAHGAVGSGHEAAARVSETPEPYDAAASRSVADLTDREFQTLRLLGRGMSTSAIAAELALAESTVRSYKSALRGKLGLHGDSALALYARDRGLE